MNNIINSFGNALRIARRSRNLTQRELADMLHMSVRTIIEAEKGDGNPKFETVILIVRELNISLDTIVFPNSAVTPVSKNVIDFFSGKSEAEVQKYIMICKQIESMKNEK